MRTWLSRLVHPPMCGRKIALFMSYRMPDGTDAELWQTCGKRPGHAGKHGGYWSPISRWRLKLANRIDPE